jgi:hypothetical protein
MLELQTKRNKPLTKGKTMSSAKYQSPEDVFGAELKSLLDPKEWRVVLPEDYDDSVTVYHYNTMEDASQHNFFSVDFTDELLESAGVTHYSINADKAALETNAYLLNRLAEETANPRFDLLRVLTTYVSELRPEWDTRFIAEADSEDDWIIMDLTVDGVPYRGTFHEFSFTGDNYKGLGLPSTRRWAKASERPESAYTEAVHRLIARVEREAYEKAHPESVKALRKGLLRTLFAA